MSGTISRKILSTSRKRSFRIEITDLVRGLENPGVGRQLVGILSSQRMLIRRIGGCNSPFRTFG